MAFLEIDFFSNCLMRRVKFTAVLPMDHPGFEPWPDHSDRPYKTLYLLHGIFGDCMSWPTNSGIKRYAEDHNLAVIMPSGENGFYIDHPDYYNNFSAMIPELVEMTRRMFPLSRKREDTYIAGLSMGGYGALRNGLKYHDIFGAIVSLSAPMNLELYARGEEFGPPMTPAYARAMFGDRNLVLGSELNVKWLLDEILRKQAEVPKLYVACGTEDELLGGNEDFVTFVRNRGIALTFVTAPGGHEWDFWDSQIRFVIENWLDTEPGLML